MPDDRSPARTAHGLQRIVNATRYSIDGIAAAWRHEPAFREEIVAAAILVPLALALDVSGLGKALMIGSVMLVLIVEVLNSAVEATIDHISLERHPLAGRAKDLGSAAVMLSLANLLIVWGLVLFG
jgi:diacylglycerol kinase (ATP)